MIKNITNRLLDDLDLINGLVGPQHKFWTRLKGGPFSPRFIINGASIDINKRLIRAHNCNYSTVERRDNGIIVNFYSVLNHYIWVIPYIELSITIHKDNYTISDQKSFIKYSHKSITRSHQQFMERLIYEQRQYLQGIKKEVV